MASGTPVEAAKRNYFSLFGPGLISVGHNRAPDAGLYSTRMRAAGKEQAGRRAVDLYRKRVVNRSSSSAVVGACSALIFSCSLQAATLTQSIQSGWNTFTSNVQQTWQQPQNSDFYLPAITWHNRWTYDDEHIKRYNERPWGAGGGISRYDDKGNWHGLYLMAFKDSYNKWEPFTGYGWEATWHPIDGSRFHLGAGYTAGVTARDNWRYIPVPALLPLASVGYGPLNFQMTYIPGTYNNGNVYFAWLRFQF